MINKAIKKLSYEAGEDMFLKTMARQIGDIINHHKTVGTVLDEDKKLSELKKKFDDFAREHKTGNQSVIPPDTAETIICEYYNLPRLSETPKTKINILDIL